MRSIVFEGDTWERYEELLKPPAIIRPRRLAMNLDVPKDQYEELRRYIASADSPVGIDATKTHVMILKKLFDIEERLAGLEARLGDRAETRR